MHRKKLQVIKMIKNILVPVDGSDSSEKSIDYAISLAKTYRAKLIFLYVANVNQLAINPSLTQAIMGAMRAAGAAVLERAGNMVPLGVEYQQIMETGAPAAVILECAETLNADLIIMGSRGLGVVKSVLLGSVSQYIIERAKIPVLIVK
jgi:nucleotide-binding universal stress UspA family protein